MTKHDQKRIAALRKTLEKAKGQAEIVALYLTVNKNDQEQLMDVNLVGEHIDIALERIELRDRT